MGKHHDYEFLQSVTWYAVDADERVAAFDLGLMPRLALDLAMQWESVDEKIRSLPEFSDYRLLTTRDDITRAKVKGISQQSKDHLADAMMLHRKVIVSELPRRGVYQFEGEMSPYGQLPPKYRLIGVPISPIQLESLPDDVQHIIRSVVAPMRFSQAKEVDVRCW